MAFCPTCKRPFERNAEFCPFDGTALQLGDGGLSGQTAGELVAVSAVESSIRALELAQEENQQSYQDLIGKTLDGRYRIEEVLGEGGMGIVFLAKHVVIEKVVAVKVLKKDASKNENIAKRFVREAKAASRIAHPNIIDVTDFGTTENGLTYSVMEYVAGVTLAETIRSDSPMDAERVLNIAAQMTRALQAAHDKGVVHRDLKPENVFLVDRDGRRDFVKIVDFGIARVLPIPGNSEVSRLTRVGSVFGTPEYMAPEQAAGRSDADHRVDIYALGTIMYEMLSGQVPHKGDSTVRTLAMQMLDRVKPLSQLEVIANIDREVESLVLRALEKKRDARWPNMTAMLEAILPLFDHGETIRESFARPPTGAVDETPTEVEVQPRSMASAERTETNVVGAPLMTAAPTEIYQMLTPKGEPAFVRRSRRPSIDDLIDDDSIPPPVQTSQTAIVVVAFIATAMTTLVLVAFLRNRAPKGDQPEVASVAGSDVTTAGARFDASPSMAAATAALDAAAETAFADGGASGGSTSRSNRNPKNPLRIDGGASGGGAKPRPAKGNFEVEVITRPSGGTLWSGREYAGSSGVVISRARGMKLKLRCSKIGYERGYVTVKFEGGKDLAVCWMKKKTKCVDGLKSPYAKCP